MTLEVDADEIELGSRQLEGVAGWLIPLVAACWSLFQLAIVEWLLLDSVMVRAIHLAFAISLVFFSFPIVKKHWRLGPTDLSLGLIGAACALYLAMDYQGIAERQGLPLFRDVLVGVTLLALLLEASRRALGPALPLLALIFMVSSLYASSLPEFLASRDVSLRHLVSKLTLSTEGVYGIPLRVSADTVFYFVLFGALLERAGGGHYFVELAYSVLGRFRGGPAKAAVLASGLTGMVSGSSIANTVTTGTFTIPLMKKCGYPAAKAGAVEVAASTNGQLMPPIMGAAAFIIAEYCNLPYMEVVKAAIIPAAISYLALIYITHLEALKLNLQPLPKSELPPFWKTLGGGLHFLLPIAFLIYELVVLRRSASAAAYQAVMVLAVVVVLRELAGAWFARKSLVGSLKGSAMLLWESLVAGGRNMMGIGVAVGAAGVIVGVVSMGLGGKVTEVIRFLSGGNLYAMLLITAIVSLILGLGLPTTANYIVMANLTAPAIIALAGDWNIAVPLIAAHLFCFYFGILADDTPPVGLAAYAASAIAKSHPIKTGIQGFTYDMRTAILPFMFIFNTDLLLIGIHHWSDGMVIFSAGLIGMCAFAALTQGHFVRHNRWYESLCLGGIVFLMLRPDLFSQLLEVSKSGVYAMGGASFSLLAAWQFWGSNSGSKTS